MTDDFTDYFFRPLIGDHHLEGPPENYKRSTRDDTDWTNLVAWSPPNYRFPRAEDMTEARAQLKGYLAERDQRFLILENFFRDNNVEFDSSDRSVAAVNRFYAEHVFCNDRDTDIDNRWIHFAWHYGLFLGDIAIQRAAKKGRKLRWGVEDVSIRQLESMPRPVFKISNHRFKIDNWRPDTLIMRCGRFVVQHGGPDKTPLPAIGPDKPEDLFLWTIYEKIKHTK